MKKLKTILKYSEFILLIIIILCFLYLKLYVPKSKFNGLEREVYGYVRKINDKYIEIKSKEKLIVYYDNNINLKYNDYVRIDGNLKLPDNNTVFNTFNYKEYLKNKNINYIMYSNKITIERNNSNFLYSIKNYIYNKIKNNKSYPYQKIFLLGDKSELDNIDLYSSLGIIHLFSISGMHISLLCFMLNKLLKKIRYKNIVIYIFLLFFIFITSYQVSIIRSALSKLFNDLNEKYKLNISSKDRLIIIAIFLLIINPFYINDLGYKFSIIISYFIIKYSSFLQNQNYLNKSILLSLITFVSSLPLVINNNYSVNFLSIFLNIIYIPFVSFIIFPLTLISLVLPIDTILFKLINLFEYISYLINDINILTFSFSKIPFIFIIFYYLILFKNKYKIIIIFLIILFYFNNSYLFDFRLYMIDVKQGDSSLIRYKNKNILIDTGGNKNIDLYKNNIIFFKSIGVKKIDYLIITHGDYDHMGESIYLVNNFRVENVIFNCGEYNDLEKKLIEVLEKKNINYYSCIKELNIGKYKLQFLNTKEYDNENDNSSVIYFNYNNYKFLFMGDAGIQREKDILEKYNLKDIDFLKVGHHGSNTSSSEDFINSVKPKYSLISVGKNNRYGHPKDEVLDTLKNSKIYRTDLDGSIEIKINKREYKIRTCPP